MRCTGCRTENPDGQKFCTTCGRQLAGCPVCGAPLQPQHRFCGDCGAPTDGGSAGLVPDVPEAVRAGRESEEIFDRLGARAFVGRLKALPERALPAPAQPAVTTTSPPAAPSAGMPPSER